MQGNWFEDREQYTVGSNDGLRCAKMAYKEMMEQSVSSDAQPVRAPAQQASLCRGRRGEEQSASGKRSSSRRERSDLRDVQGDAAWSWSSGCLKLISERNPPVPLAMCGMGEGRRVVICARTRCGGRWMVFLARRWMREGGWESNGAHGWPVAAAGSKATCWAQPVQGNLLGPASCPFQPLKPSTSSC